MNSNKKLDQRGSVDSWLLAFGAMLILFFGAIGFGVWAYTGMQDYKNNVDPKIASAVEEAKTATAAQKDEEFVEKEKEPLKIYTGPSAYGSIAVSYPKTWAAYVDESGRSSAPLDGQFNPNFVPGLQSGNNVALHIQVINTPYAEVAKSFDSAIKTGKVQAVPYALPKVPDTVGLRFTGEIVTKKQGALVILPVRDKTLKIWAEATQFIPDFDNIILKNLTFIP